MALQSYSVIQPSGKQYQVLKRFWRREMKIFLFSFGFIERSIIHIVRWNISSTFLQFFLSELKSWPSLSIIWKLNCSLYGQMDLFYIKETISKGAYQHLQLNIWIHNYSWRRLKWAVCFHRYKITKSKFQQ